MPIVKGLFRVASLLYWVCYGITEGVYRVVDFIFDGIEGDNPWVLYLWGQFLIALAIVLVIVQLLIR